MVDLKRLHDAMWREDVHAISTELGYRGDRSRISCVCCKTEIPYDKHGFLNRCVRISRGDFRYEDGTYIWEDENIKFETFLCSKCFLEDPDLCAFFNKLGLRVR